jgi:hypothetical protein
MPPEDGYLQRLGGQFSERHRSLIKGVAPSLDVIAWVKVIRFGHVMSLLLMASCLEVQIPMIQRKSLPGFYWKPPAIHHGFLKPSCGLTFTR